MSSEIEVPETPNWLQELEAKRERRVKARLGHETGAGAPCLKCGDKCPGLDLHFWRKCCKICKCAKEEHEVQDDDIYGWAQFQLLGSKPNKIKRKIVLPGKKDEVELDWAPKGHKETVDKYLKTLPPEQLAVKGSQAAQDRKQLLHKQIPVHDIDPTLCHELTEDELKQMNDYVSHVKQASVGVGQIVSLSSIIKGNLHNLNPSEASIIASRYAKGVPLSEIVKLQSQSRAGLLKPHGLSQNLEKLTINDPHSKHLPIYSPNSINPTEQNLNPLVANKVHDVNYPGYTRNVNNTLPNAQFSSGLKPGPFKGFISGTQPGQNQPTFDTTISEKYMQNPNFDPKSIPSHFITQTTPYEQPYPGRGGQPNVPYDESSLGHKSGDGAEQVSSAFVPYNKVFSGIISGENYTEANPRKGVNYSSNLPGYGRNIPSGFTPSDNAGQNIPGGNRPQLEEMNPEHPNYRTIITKDVDDPNIKKNTFGDQFNHGGSPYRGDSGFKPGHTIERSFSPQSPKFGTDNSIYENAEEMRNRNVPSLPNYAPGKYAVQSEVQTPTTIPKNVRDLAFSTYDQSTVDPNQLEYNISDPRGYQNFPSTILGPPNISYENYPPGFTPGSTVGVGEGDKFLDQGTPSISSGNNQYGRINDTPNRFRPTITGVTDNEYPLVGPEGNQYGNINDNYPIGTKPVNAGGIGSNPPYGDSTSFDQHGIPPDSFPIGVIPGGRGISNKNYPGGDMSGHISPGDPNTAVNYPYGHNTSIDQHGVPFDSYPTGITPGGTRISNKSRPSGDTLGHINPGDPSTALNPPYGHNTSFDQHGAPFDSYPTGVRPGGTGISNKNRPSGDTLGHINPGDPSTVVNPHYGHNTTFDQHGVPFDNYPTGISNKNHPGDDMLSHINPGDPNTAGSHLNIPYEGYPSEFEPTGNNSTVTGSKYPEGQQLYENVPANVPGSRLGKKLSELHPGTINVNEDFVHPSHVTIGAIQDINYPEIKAATHGTNDFYEDYSPDSLREILNNIILPDCHYCKKPFEENEFAITIDRANVLFHAECFKCAGCNQILADNVYFYNKETDNIYCGRDYAKIRGFPRCKACDELIFTKEYCLAENSTFHLKHFCCMECDKPLAGQDYILEEEIPYCLPCFEQSKASKCNTCCRVIKPDEMGCNLKGVHFHASDDCFACKMCKKPLMGKKLLLRNEKLYCSHDCFGADK